MIDLTNAADFLNTHFPVKKLEEKLEQKEKKAAGANLKMWTPDLRQELCRAYCEHIAKGFSNESFVGYKSGIGKGFIKISYRTVKTYIENYPEDFPADYIECAEAERLYFWEVMGISGSAGKLRGFNSRSWEFNMQNRFKWRIRNDVTTQDEKIAPNIIYLPREEGVNAKD